MKGTEVHGIDLVYVDSFELYIFQEHPLACVTFAWVTMWTYKQERKYIQLYEIREKKELVSDSVR